MTLDEFRALLATFEDDDACWIWPKSLDKRGYGQVWIRSTPGPRGKRLHRAHRVSAHVALGLPLGSSLHVLHDCDTPACFNPGCLTVGTNRDNMADRNIKGRVAVGEDAGPAKLTAAQVERIRIEAAAGRSYGAIAREYGVCRTNISAIVRGKSWRKVPRYVTEGVHV